MTPPIHVTVTTDADGAPIVSKLGRTPEAKARLRREAWILGSLRHPGVVEMVELREVDDDVRLDLVLAGSRTLKEAAPQLPSRIASMMAAVSTTLADVHTQGIGHRRLTAEHIVLDRNGQPVITGWAEAGSPHLGDDDHWVDPHAEDVAAVGSLIVELLGASDERSSRTERSARRRLTSLARSCAAERAPTMHDLAAQLARLSGAAEPAAEAGLDDAELRDLAGLDDTDAPPPSIVPENPEPVAGHTTADVTPPGTADVEVGAPGEPRRVLSSLGRPSSLVGAAAISLCLFGVLWWIVRGDGSTPPSDVAIAPTTSAQLEQHSPQTSVPPVAETTAPTTPSASDCSLDEVVGAVLRDIDGDGCDDRVVVDGNRVQIGDTTYEVGRSGDTVLVGDWDCDGQATPIVIRPDDRAIHVFARWARADQGLTATFGGTLPPQTAAETVEDADGCHLLELTGPTGVEQRRLQELGGTR